MWETGIVEDLIIGKDVHCRGAVMRRVSNKGKGETLTRPLQKLVPLEVLSTEFQVTEMKEKSTREELGRRNARNELSRDIDEFPERGLPK